MTFSVTSFCFKSHAVRSVLHFLQEALHINVTWIWRPSVTRLCDAELKTFQSSETRQNMFLCWKRCECLIITWFTVHTTFKIRKTHSLGRCYKGPAKKQTWQQDTQNEAMKLANSKKWDVFWMFFLSMWADGLRLETWTCKEIYRPIWSICSRLLDTMLFQRNFTLFGKLSH